MVDHRFDFGSGQQPNTRRQGHERRLLELQLIQVRQQASAARLEAQAAEIEIMLRRIAMAESGVAIAVNEPLIDAPLDDFNSATADTLPPAVQLEVPAACSGSGKQIKRKARAARSGTKQKSKQSPAAPTKSSEIELANTTACVTAESAPPPLAGPSPTVSSPSSPSSPATVKSRRSRPKAVLVSAAIHGALLVLLAAISLSTPRPKDQISLTAVSTQASQEPISTVKLEASDPTIDPREPTEVEADVALEPLSDIRPAELSSGPSKLTPMDSLTSSSTGSTSVESLSLSASPGEKITFCGVEGGGNHFVYLVDCSKSMGPAFESARAELLNSIDALKPHQRFYVIFFDAHPDYMRVSQEDMDDPRSVLATEENKRSLRRWATSIHMDSGAAPYQPLEFALELRPDVIFLLSDGEFPVGIELLLQNKNRVDNLFGDQEVKSIVHTIGYHSQQGEIRMRSIAAQNQGQYRYVPKPAR